MARPAVIRYQFDEETGKPHCSVIKAQPHHGDVALIYLTDAEIDCIVAARDEYHRETKHRGYPA